MHSVCFAAGNLNFARFYGEYLRSGIQIHHLRPDSELDALPEIDAESYLVPLLHQFLYRFMSHTDQDKFVERIQKFSS